MARTKKIVNDTLVVKEEWMSSFLESPACVQFNSGVVFADTDLPAVFPLDCRVSEKYQEAFVGNIPLESLKELPPSYM